MTADETTIETPTEEWLTNSKGRMYAVIHGPGGGTVFRKGDETVSEARARRAIETEVKRRKQAEPSPGPGRPRGKGRKPDPKPAGATKPAGKPRPSREQLAAAAELPLQVFGVFVGHQILGCQFCAESMRQNAGPAAVDLAKTTNPYLLNLLVWWHSLVSTFAGGEGLTRYVLPPLVHHAVPEPMAAFMSPFLGVPPRAPTPRREHRHTAPPTRAETQATGQQAGPTAPPPAPGQPLTPEQAAMMAAGQMPGMPPTPEQVQAMAAERAALQAEAARLAAIRDLGARQAAAAATQARGPNMPPYRASDNGAPGTPTAPPVAPEDAAGSPLPPEAEL